MQVCEGGWVWVHARRPTVGQPRRVRAGPDFEKNSAIRCQIPCQILGTGRLCFENASLVDFQSINEAMGAILMKKAVFNKENALRANGFARDPIFSTQRLPRGRDVIFSTQRLPRGREAIFSTQRFIA